MVNIPFQLVQLINLIFNSLLQSGMFSIHTFYMCRYLIIIEKAAQLQKRIEDEIDELYKLRGNINHYKKIVSFGVTKKCFWSKSA